MMEYLILLLIDPFINQFIYEAPATSSVEIACINQDSVVFIILSTVVVCAISRTCEITARFMRAVLPFVEPLYVLGGNITTVDQYPWLTLIEYTKGNGPIKTMCGGALISGRYVLTAAHCVTGAILSYGTP